MKTYKLTSPLMRGDEVKTVQRTLAGANKFRENYRPGTIDGQFGEGTAAACYRAKWAMGYPKDKLQRTYGPTLHNYLKGNTALPDAYAKRRKERKAAAKTAVSLGSKALARAKTKIGVTESPFNSNKTEFGSWYGFNGVPWCAIFATWCYVPVGSKAFARGSRFSYVGAIVARARAAGGGMTVVSDPKPGDLVCWGDRHVGLFEGRVTGGYTSIEGNWSNKVARVKHSWGGVVFVRVTG
jgi:CHAP domain